MTRQDKSVTDKFTKTLRELVKRPDNKTCADCKRNDPRWASWNIGVFLCIRCSGIHRGMGTHISKVKSVDLDVWTPEQMETIQKWGNHLANLYWEAHLKPGHIPPEHKMESFIRSKYESRRWALDGPPPSDPSTLDSGSTTSSAATISEHPQQQQQQQQQRQPSVASTASRPTHAVSDSISSRTSGPRHLQTHQLLSANLSNMSNPNARSATGAAAAPVQPSSPPVPGKAPENDLFSLDFHGPAQNSTTRSSTPPKKDVKQDILSLFSTPTPNAFAATAPAPAPINQFAAVNSSASPWLTQSQQPMMQQQQQFHQTSMLGNSGAGQWGVSSGWSGVPSAQTPGNLWANNSIPSQQQPPGMLNLNTADIWGSSTTTTTTTTTNQDPFSSLTTQKKDDAFGDIWGGFK